MRIVHVTKHAVEQARARCPEIDKDTFAVRALITEEVLDAIAQGRMATRTPRFAVRNGTTERALGRRNGAERDRTKRFVWNEACNRLYLIDRTQNMVAVVTTIRPDNATLHG